MSGLPTLLRLGRREARSHLLRTLLVGLLIGVPVFVLSGGLVVARSLDPGDETLRRWQLGNADGIVDTDEADLAAMSAEHDVSAAFRSVEVFRVADGRGRLDRIPSLSGAFDDPLVEGAFAVVDGRLPEREGEAVIPPPLARRYRVGLGDRLHLDVPDIDLRIVGLGGTGWCRCADQILLAPSTLPDGYVGAGPNIGEDTVATYSVYYQGDVAPEQWFGRSLERREATQAFIGYGLSVFVLLWTGLVAACGLAVGARRRRRELGWLAANGADPATLRLAVVAEGFVIGVAASLIGCALGILVAALAFPTVRDLTNSWSATLAIPWWSGLVAPLVGAVAAVLASMVAARDVRRATVADLLGGRGRRTRPAPAWFATGVALATAGVGTLTVMDKSDTLSVQLLAGLAVLSCALGLVAIGVGAVRILSRVQGPGVGMRLVGRDLSRQGVRSAAAVGAIALTAAGLGAWIVQSAQDGVDPEFRAPRTSYLVANSSWNGSLVLVDGEVKAERVTRSGLEPLRRAFEKAGLVSRWLPPVLVPVTTPDGSWEARGLIVDEVLDLFTSAQRETMRNGGVLETSDYSTGPPMSPELMADAYLLRSTAQRLGLKAAEEPETLVAYGHLDDAAASELRDRIRGRNVYVGDDQRLYGDLTVPEWIRWSVFGAAAVVTVVVLALALALQRVESRPDEAVLVQVGAGPRLRRLMAAQRAALLSAVAVVPGVAVGAVVIVAVNDRWVTVPWLDLVGSMVAIPLVAFLLFGMFVAPGRSPQPRSP